ncbi:Leucine Rich repeats (2 copies) [Thalassoglobus neptunius]|uniref:Leucine Rich repeats (2 copies) n=1 Tax=Thalassoglobus neptunius TaxID=1938619 RepID=A0A5C5WYF3_9PLAN|nr:hypothetical protein [Thalassoglobus neptunius]TWT55610.1 Leucine Rich repeats (2 copies) [Thalassoglobus neptunius]
MSKQLLLLALLASLQSSVFADEPADAKAPSVQAIKKVGGNVMAIAQNDPRLDVTLHLADQDVTDPILEHVAALENVAWLNLAGTKISDDGLAHLSDLKSLEKLHLEKTAVGDKGLKHLSGLKHLVYLNLYGTNVTDAGIDELAKLKSLRRVYLWQSKVTDSGIEKLQNALPEAQVVGAIKLTPVEPPKPEAEKKEPEKN